jgi:hypothetical protein
MGFEAEETGLGLKVIMTPGRIDFDRAHQGINDLERGKVGKVTRVFRNDGEGIGDVCEAWKSSLRRSPEKVREKEDVELGEVCLERICTVGCLRHPSFTLSDQISALAKPLGLDLAKRMGYQIAGIVSTTPRYFANFDELPKPSQPLFLSVKPHLQARHQ